MTALISMYASVVSWLYSEKKHLLWLKSERGQTTIEYILVIVLVVLVIVFAFQGAAIESAIDAAVAKIALAISKAPTQ